jgi:hypothetical protein
MAVASEVAVQHERLDTLERLLESKGIINRQEIEQFMPSLAVGEERQLWHAKYIARILRIVQQELEALESDPSHNRSMEDIAKELGKVD